MPVHIISSLWPVRSGVRSFEEIRSNFVSMLRFSAYGLSLQQTNENPCKLVRASITIFFILVFLFFSLVIGKNKLENSGSKSSDFYN